jgi:hypothetical protein
MPNTARTMPDALAAIDADLKRQSDVLRELAEHALGLDPDGLVLATKLYHAATATLAAAVAVLNAQLSLSAAEALWGTDLTLPADLPAAGGEWPAPEGRA